MDMAFVLPERMGSRPNTTRHIPHSQLDQNSPEEIVLKLAEWAFSLTHVQEEPSGISVPGARAFVLAPGVKSEPNAMMIGREFGHIHPDPLPGSLHLQLPTADVQEVIEKGWGEHHFLVEEGRLPVGTVMVYAPRNEDDLGVIKQIISRSHQYACAVLSSENDSGQ